MAVTAEAATITVTSTADSGPGSLRQAILDTNTLPGSDTIKFDIPGPGPHTIALASALPAITDTLILDGTTEPDSTPGSPVVVLEGSATAPGTDGLVLQAPSSVVRGIAIAGFRGDGIVIAGAGGVLEGSIVGIPAGNLGSGVVIDGASNARVGGSGAARNVISGNGAYGVFVSGASGTSILGNFIGTSAAGTSAVPNAFDGMLVFQSDDTSISGNVIAGNGASGVYVDTGSTGASIFDNFIGADATGSAVIGNALDGVVIDGAAGNAVGAPGAGNIISNNGGPGVTITGPGATGNTVQGNRIGTGSTDADARGNAFEGVYVVDAPGNTIGGTINGAGNVIAYNGAAGVFVDIGAGNDILGNSIFANVGLGIDLDPVGVTPNDQDDTDSGANGLQNSPVFSVSGTAVQGTLQGEPSATYRVELFVNVACDPAGSGEGAIFAGAVSFATNASGAGAFTATLAAPLASGQVLTATATGPSGTSEFSACVAASAPGTSADVSIALTAAPAEVASGTDLTLTLTVANAGPSQAAAVTVATSTPAGTVFRSASTTAGSCTTPAAGASGPITCAIGALSSGATATVTVVLDVLADPGATVTAQASAATTTTDPTAGNNTASASASVVAPSVDPPVVASIRALAGGKPFRIKIVGSNFQPGVVVFIGADTSPWPNVKLKSGTSITLKGGKALKARFPKGTPVTLRIVNPDGGQATTSLTR